VLITNQSATPVRRTSCITIGTSFGRRTYSEIVRDPHYGFAEGRLDLGRPTNEIQGVALPANCAHCGPAIYVNNTIPGFILYRMAYACNYTVGTDGFSIKSEIIDISIPRAGSAEIYMSQEGAVTRFRLLGGFTIPGWGISLLRKHQPAARN
jgi:hypothetical protein